LLVFVNGNPTKQVNIKKTLKQGDPLAPFLFLLLTKGLGSLMKFGGNFFFSKTSRFGGSEVVISHFQYVADTLFIVESCVENL